MISSLKMQANLTWTGLVASFCITTFLVIGFLCGAAILRGQSAGTFVSWFFTFDAIASILLVSVSFLISAFWRHKLVWVLVSVVPSLIWREVGFPIVLVASLDNFSVLPSAVTLGMTILFLIVEIVEARIIGASYIGVSDEEGMIALDLKKDK